MAHTSATDMNLDKCYLDLVSAAAAFADEIYCFGSPSFLHSQHIVVDEMIDNNLASCTELNMIATRSVHIYMRVNRRPINYVRVLGLGLLCTPVSGMRVFTADTCPSDLCNIEQCVALVTPDDYEYPTCTYRCPSSSRETEYVIVSAMINNGNTPIICEIYSYWPRSPGACLLIEWWKILWHSLTCVRTIRGNDVNIYTSYFFNVFFVYHVLFKAIKTIAPHPNHKSSITLWFFCGVYNLDVTAAT